MGIYNGTHAGAEIDAALDSVLVRWDATNSNNTFCTSDNVMFSKEGVTIGKNGCTIINNVEGKPYYFAQSNNAVVTLTKSTFGVGTSYLWGVFIDSDKLVRGGRVTSIVNCMVCAVISNPDSYSSFYNIINNQGRYILFAYIYKGEFTPAGVFAKPEFYPSSSEPESTSGEES